MSLPKGFKRLEWIRFTGSQYINTNFIPDSNSAMEIEFDNTGATTGCIIGQDSGWLNKAFAIFYQVTEYGNQAGHYSNRFGHYTMKLDKNQRYVNGELEYTYPAQAFSGSYPIWIGRLNRNGSSADAMDALTVFSCKLWDRGTLVRDYVPCQNASGTVGLWDAVNEVFYGNAGTGTFTAGPIVPEVVDESEITELEYVESNGTQYADTLFIPNQDTRVEADVQFDTVSGSSSKCIFGARSAQKSNNYSVTSLSGYYRNYYGTSEKSFGTSVTFDTKFHISKNKNICVLDGVATIEVDYTEFTAPVSMYLFALNGNGSATFMATAKIYAFQIYDNGLLERDYIPAMLTNGEVGLYDRVFHEFYRNAGTGEFIAGPEMVHENCVELEHIESNGNQYIDSLFTPNQDTRIVLKYGGVTESGWHEIFGSGQSVKVPSKNFVGVQSSESGVMMEYSSTYYTAPVTSDGSVIDVNKNVYSIDGVVVYTFAYATFTAPYTMRIFDAATASKDYPIYSGKVYFCQLYDNGNEVRIYIPMLHPSGVAGLWDSVNERFYASATTADFIAGPEAQTVPKAPTNFRVKASTDTLVTLVWDPTEEVLGYRLYRQGQLLADTTETSISVTVEPFAGAVFSLMAYNENGEGAAAELTYYSIPENPLLYLITDRTAQDVAERNPKGYYAASDLNRVGYAVEYLTGRLRSSGVTVTVSPVLTWTDADWPTPSTMKNYLSDVQTMRGALKLADTTPKAPDDMVKLTYEEANQIEMILLALDTHIRNMLAIVDAGWASGLAYTGFYAKEAY